MARPPILTLSDIALTFGGNPLFSGLDLSLQPGDRVALVGRNGSGKSTFYNLIYGLLKPQQGSIQWEPSQGWSHRHQKSIRTDRKWFVLCVQPRRRR